MLEIYEISHQNKTSANYRKAFVCTSVLKWEIEIVSGGGGIVQTLNFTLLLLLLLVFFLQY